MSGLTSTGFIKKTLPEIKAELEEILKTNFGAALNLLPESVFGQLVGIISEREGLVWDQMELVYNSAYPDTAFGTSLDNANALVGVRRLKAEKSRVLEQLLFGSAATSVPAGTVFNVQGDATARFVTDESVTLVAGVDEVQNIAFSAVPVAGTWKIKYKNEETSVLAFNANAATIQAAINALNGLSGVTVSGTYGAGFVVTFAGADGKQNQPLLVISLNTLSVTVTVTETTAGVPQATVTMTAENTGPITAPAGTLNEIATPVFGLNSTKNSEDAIVGRNVETDAEYRVRREQELQGAGSGTVEAIRAALLEVDGVTQAIVFENDSMVTDLDGLPAKSVRAFVQGGIDQEIADKLWLAKGGGIETSGDELEVVNDSQGLPHNIYFSRPVNVPIYITIEITKDFSAASNIATQVRDALEAFINGLEIGQDVVVYPHLICALDQIQGIIDIEIGIGTSVSPPLGQDANIAIEINELARMVNKLTDITVTVI